ncbi:retrovirus-related Pol polyprotein from transposon 297 [Magallana gigas]|uniref:retrovirus-related Pol polyprotein from transposon 297 n=1 Tax=Magallana gigas TaxID=29159 RepID=UPI0033418C9A
MSVVRSELPIPLPMNVKGDLKGNWKFFKSQWMNYEIATGLDKKHDAIRIATLLTVIGKDCYHIYENLNLTEEERQDIAAVIEALQKHFTPKTNVIYERYIFNTSDQLPNETLNDYICRLRELAKSCEFRNMTDDMIRDRLVLGTKDTASRGRMLREADLTLDKAITMCLTSERTSSQLQKLEHNTSHTANSEQAEVKYVSSKGDKAYKPRGKHPFKGQGKKQQKTVQPKNSAMVIKCKYCGGTHPRDRDKCPAFGHTCWKCKKKNHFPKVCKQTTVNSIQDEDTSDSDSDSLYAVNSSSGKQWFVKIHMSASGNSSNVTCQLDSGSTCNVINFRQYAQIMQTGDPPLKPTEKTLKLYGGKSKLIPLGIATLKCRVIQSGKTENLDFYVVEMDQTPILSAEACEKLGLLTVNVVHKLTATSSQFKPMSKEQILSEFKDVFEGLGEFEGEYHIELDPTVKPVQRQPRRVPQALKGEIKEKIESLVKRGVLKKVSSPTDWISNMVAVKKPGKLRLCIDPKDLNSAIKRPHYQMPTVDDILPKISKAKVFTVMDAKEGFWHVKLDKESSLLTTFWTPFGRYHWTRLPFGLSSAPEEFQRKQHEVLEGLQHTEVIMDDILVYGSGETMDDAIRDHDFHLQALLQRAREVGLKLNKEKLKLRLTSVKYMGQILTSEGMCPDPDKVKAVVEMPRPKNVKDVQRLIGLVTYLSKYLPHLSETCEPLRRLTVKDTLWHWESQQENAFKAIKQLVSTEPVLKYYDVNEEVTIQCDASEVGLGATLMQQGQPVAYASKALSQTEQRYAQIEKECLAIVFACEHFDQYIYGRDLVTVQSDHKPLETIFKKSLLAAPKRLQRMLLRLQKYNLRVTYTKGSELYIADTLSRAFVTDTEYIFNAFSQEISQINQSEWIPKISHSRFQQIREMTNSDPVLQTLKTVILTGWNDRQEDVPVAVRDYWNIRDELTAQDGLIYKSNRVVIPKVLRPEMLSRIHSSHLGTESCLRKARDAVFWPNMSAELRDFISKCSTCNKMQDQQSNQPLITHDVPKIPWTKLGVDIFTYQNQDYLVTVDYFSDFFELDILTDTSAMTVIDCLKQQFARHGIPDTVISDNGPQFKSADFHTFACDWEFEHSTSSPYHSQSNGKAESAVKIAKKLVKKCISSKTDIWKAILDWRNTPTKDMNCSPVQRLMSRRTRHSLPTAAALLEPNISTNTHEKIMRKRQLSKQQYDKHTKDLPELQIGQNVRMKKHPNDKYWQFGTCTQSLGNRSYLIDLNGKAYRRNRREMRPTKEAHDAERTDPLPYKPEDDPLMITNEPPQYESVKQPIAPKPQTAFGSSRETITSPTSDNNCAVNASTKLRGSSRIARLPSKFNDFIMN